MISGSQRPRLRARGDRPVWWRHGTAPATARNCKFLPSPDSDPISNEQKLHWKEPFRNRTRLELVSKSISHLFSQARLAYGEYLAELRGRISEVKQELADWWDRCHVDDDQRSPVHPLNEGLFRFLPRNEIRFAFRGIRDLNFIGCKV